MAQRCWLPGSLSGSPHPPRTQSDLLKVLPKAEYPLSHMTSVCWKRSTSKEGVTLQNSSALGLANFSRKVWEGCRILSAAEPGVQRDAEKTGKTQSWKLFLTRPGLWSNRVGLSRFCRCNLGQMTPLLGKMAYFFEQDAVSSGKNVTQGHRWSYIFFPCFRAHDS